MRQISTSSSGPSQNLLSVWPTLLLLVDTLVYKGLQKQWLQCLQSLATCPQSNNSYSISSLWPSPVSCMLSLMAFCSITFTEYFQNPIGYVKGHLFIRFVAIKDAIHNLHDLDTMHRAVCLTTLDSVSQSACCAQKFSTRSCISMVLARWLPAPWKCIMLIKFRQYSGPPLHSKEDRSLSPSRPALFTSHCYASTATLFDKLHCGAEM